jgi:peptide subunit release factor 1 (eRF1)
MIAWSDVERLRRLPPMRERPVLSVYLDVDQRRPANMNRGFEAAFETRLRALAGSVDDLDRKSFDTAAARVREVVAHYQAHARTFVIMADATGELDWRGELRIALPADARWEPQPHVQPLLEAFDEHERYGVILADKGRARIFTVFLGEIEEERDALAAAEVRHKQASGTDHLRSQMQFQRQDDEHVHAHLRDVAAVMDEVARTRHLARLILAGPVEATSELAKCLPRPLAERVVGTMRLAFDVPAAEMLERTLAIAERVERDMEQRVVERVVDHGTRGAAATLAALQQGRVMLLVYAEGFVETGAECTGCGVLAARDAGGACGYCNAPMQPLDDVVGRAVVRARDAGATVEQVRGDAAERLRDVGSIGAVLRF